MKSNISTIKSGIEQFKLQYSEDLTKLGILSTKFWISATLKFFLPNFWCLSSFFVVLGDHLRIVSHAASGYHKVLEENRKLYNQIQDLRGTISLRYYELKNMKNTYSFMIKYIMQKIYFFCHQEISEFIAG